MDIKPFDNVGRIKGLEIHEEELNFSNDLVGGLENLRGPQEEDKLECNGLSVLEDSQMMSFIGTNMIYKCPKEWLMKNQGQIATRQRGLVNKQTLLMNDHNKLENDQRRSINRQLKLEK